MNTRKSLTSLGLALVLAAPLGAFAGNIWVTTRGEAVSRIVNPVLGQPVQRVAPDPAPPLRVGSVSRDGQYLYAGEEGGWQFRPMQYRFEGGRLVHVDEPAGHMERLADSSAYTPAQLAALASSGGR